MVTPILEEFNYPILKHIYLPLETLDKCSYCGKEGGSEQKLSWCTSCAEVLYCSPECQKEDWKSHKLKCGKTDRIDLKSYYPFIAFVNATNHINPPLGGEHPALCHQILHMLTDPDSAGENPSGASVKKNTVVLGEPLDPSEAGSPKWWPTAITDAARDKLCRRIEYEGYVLPNIVATSIALLSEMYTTTSHSAKELPPCERRRRVRLSYHRSPIADFGIIHGSVPVDLQDRLHYKIGESGKSWAGFQDPDDHYWMYFTTLSGEELILDCNLFTFNMGVMVKADPMPYDIALRKELTPAPAILFDPGYAKRLPLLDEVPWVPRKKVSILRHPRLLQLARTGGKTLSFSHEDEYYPVLFAIMEEISGRRPSDTEQDVVQDMVHNSRKLFYRNVEYRSYLKYPKEPPISIMTDLRVMQVKDDEELYRYFLKWSRKGRG